MGEKFQSVFSIPYFMLSFREGEPSRHVFEDGAEIFKAENESASLLSAFARINPEPFRHQDENGALVIIGSPIYDGRLRPFSTIFENIALNDGVNRSFIEKLDGEFLIFYFNKRGSRFFIINDRFTSFPVFYFHDKEAEALHATPYFSVLWDYLKKSGNLKIDNNAFFEFLWFQRLFGKKTYSENTFFLEDASILEFSANRISTTRYWQRSYSKSTLPLIEHSYRMADLVKKSVRIKTSDGKRYGHFLSGGMDSRSVLAAFENNLPVCFTSTVSENRELKTARNIAETKGAKHVFLELDPEHYAKILESSVRVIGGMYNYDHGLFYGYNDVVKSYSDVCFHGHGFDYMFQGMYIPGKSVVIGGRTLYARTLMELPEDIIGYFISNASYRIKNADVWEFVRPEFRASLKEFQRGSITEILRQGEELTDDPYDLWEYLTFHHISRHYSYPNHASIATFAEQRTVSFMNELFDLYLSLPVKHRFNGRIEKQCLKILDERLAKIWSANTNLPVTASCWTQTLYQLAGAIKRRIFPVDEKPAWAERTWPTRDHALRNQQGLKVAVRELCNSEVLEQLDFLDTEKIKKLFPRWIDGENIRGISGDLVQTVLNAGTFLKQK